MIHTYVKRAQANHLSNLISLTNNEHVLLQVDFSENASIVHHNEIQSAHWSHQQVTLLTGYYWFNSTQNQKKGIIFISDCLTHGELAVYYFMENVIKHLDRNPEIKHLHVFSEGAASQFKQHYFLIYMNGRTNSTWK